MSRYVGIDIEQFVRDPYATGIQRVLQYLAKQWPVDDVRADFVIPNPLRGGEFFLLDAPQAATLLTLPFEPREPGSDLREIVNQHIAELNLAPITFGDLLSIYDAWLLPEVSYLPSVLERLEIFRRCMPTTLIGYDALPMTQPANYRFKPGSAGSVSEYFRMLAVADHVVCISDYARDDILGRLRRDRALPISVAHPGGDHLDPCPGQPPARPRFARLGTMEARKQPVEILTGFTRAVDDGLDAELLFIGNKSASAESINRTITGAIEAGYPVTWVQGASDSEVYDLVNSSSAFLSIGIEGYGIPVLEAIRLGTPVLFDGIQPAGDLMQGRGSRRVDASSPDAMVWMFGEYGSPGPLDGLRTEVDSTNVPTWADFACRVARSAASM